MLVSEIVPVDFVNVMSGNCRDVKEDLDTWLLQTRGLHEPGHVNWTRPRGLGEEVRRDSGAGEGGGGWERERVVF